MVTEVRTEITFGKEGHCSDWGKGYHGAFKGAGNGLHLDLGGPYMG